jgi:hypothetical protein
MNSFFVPMLTEHQTRHRCQNCEQIWTTADLQTIKNFFQRVTAGEPCPSGECPACGALCQPISRIEDRSEAIKIVADLVEWSTMMGDWEGIVWQRAIALLNRIREEEELCR